MHNALIAVTNELDRVVMVKEFKSSLCHFLSRLVERSNSFDRLFGIGYSISGHRTKTDVVASDARVLVHKSLCVVDNTIHRYVRKHYFHIGLIDRSFYHRSIERRARILNVGISHLLELLEHVGKSFLAVEIISDRMQIKSKSFL